MMRIGFNPYRNDSTSFGIGKPGSSAKLPDEGRRTCSKVWNEMVNESEKAGELKRWKDRKKNKQS